MFRTLAEGELVVPNVSGPPPLVQRVPKGRVHAARTGQELTLCGLDTGVLVEFGSYFAFAEFPDDRTCVLCAVAAQHLDA